MKLVQRLSLFERTVTRKDMFILQNGDIETNTLETSSSKSVPHTSKKNKSNKNHKESDKACVDLITKKMTQSEINVYVKFTT